MSIINKVMPGDQLEAERLDACCQYCLIQAREAYKKGYYNHADLLVEDYRKAKRDLDKLVQAKQENDQLKQLVRTLQGRDGVNLTIIQKVIFGEQKG
jgi:hypothetical protein